MKKKKKKDADLLLNDATDFLISNIFFPRELTGLWSLQFTEGREAQ